jgi:hypothetical protein
MNLFYSNKKLKKDGIFKWSLPAGLVDQGGTCIGAGACLKFCMFKKIYKFRGPRCIGAHKRNLELARSPWFADICIYELQARRVIKRLRVHDSGDYFDQDYVQAWARIAQAVPRVFFYSYTKSAGGLDLDPLRSLHNYRVIESVGGCWPVDRRRVHSIVLPRGADRIPAGYADGSVSDLVALNSKRIALKRI